MSHFRKFSKTKIISLPFFLTLVLFLLGPPLPRFGKDQGPLPQNAKADGVAAQNVTSARGNASPGSLEQVSAKPKKGKITRTVWLVAALVAVTGIAAYFILTGAAKGSIDVQSSPPGAAIFIDNDDTGKVTPALLAKIKTGNHSLTLKKDGLQDYTVAIAVEKNKTAEVNAELLALAMSEDFNDNSADHWQNNGLGTWDIVNGVYRFRGSAGGSGVFAYSWYDLGSYADFTCQAKLRNGGDKGLAFRGNPATGEWYVFYAWSTDWAVFRYTATTFDYLVHYTYSMALKLFPEWNEFKVVAKGSNFGFYINGILVGSAYDTHQTKGKIGLQVRDFPGVTMEADDVSVSLSTATATLPVSTQHHE
jgi:hypothetical protein